MHCLFLSFFHTSPSAKTTPAVGLDIDSGEMKFALEDRVAADCLTQPVLLRACSASSGSGRDVTPQVRLALNISASFQRAVRDNWTDQTRLDAGRRLLGSCLRKQIPTERRKAWQFHCCGRTHSVIGCARLWERASCLNGYRGLRDVPYLPGYWLTMSDTALCKWLTCYSSSNSPHTVSNSARKVLVALGLRVLTRNKVRLGQRRNAMAGKLEISQKTRRPAASSGTNPTCENSAVARPGIEPVGLQRYDGSIARLACRSDVALGVRVIVASIASSLLDLGRAATYPATSEYRTCASLHSESGALPLYHAKTVPPMPMLRACGGHLFAVYAQLAIIQINTHYPPTTGAHATTVQQTMLEAPGSAPRRHHQAESLHQHANPTPSNVINIHCEQRCPPELVIPPPRRYLLYYPSNIFRGSDISRSSGILSGSVKRRNGTSSQWRHDSSRDVDMVLKSYCVLRYFREKSLALNVFDLYHRNPTPQHPHHKPRVHNTTPSSSHLINNLVNFLVLQHFIKLIHHTTCQFQQATTSAERTQILLQALCEAGPLNNTKLVEPRVFRGLSWQQARLDSPLYTRDDIIVCLLVAVSKWGLCTGLLNTHSHYCFLLSIGSQLNGACLKNCRTITTVEEKNTCLESTSPPNEYAKYSNYEALIGGRRFDLLRVNAAVLLACVVGVRGISDCHLCIKAVHVGPRYSPQPARSEVKAPLNVKLPTSFLTFSRSHCVVCSPPSRGGGGSHKERWGEVYTWSAVHAFYNRKAHPKRPLTLPAVNLPRGARPESASFKRDVIRSYSTKFPFLMLSRLKPMRVIEVRMVQCRNERVVETGDPRENPPTNGIVRHKSHMRKSGANRSATVAPFWTNRKMLTTGWPSRVQQSRKGKCVITDSNMIYDDTFQNTVESSIFFDWPKHVLVHMNGLRTNHKGSVCRRSSVILSGSVKYGNGTSSQRRYDNSHGLCSQLKGRICRKDYDVFTVKMAFLRNESQITKCCCGLLIYEFSEGLFCDQLSILQVRIHENMGEYGPALEGGEEERGYPLENRRMISGIVQNDSPMRKSGRPGIEPCFASEGGGSLKLCYCKHECWRFACLVTCAWTACTARLAAIESVTARLRTNGFKNISPASHRQTLD
ncbi:hypothetical protein PR048_023228 [Dryococelus australis]|uniref:Uncharacterized protein n=1 Tax=Dryococelus australis TaxID=614101 RepID=A0ABQ9GTJ0_9NEOP|nr:hypothetical protein PR048_023228 [Dryococelus australis]